MNFPYRLAAIDLDDTLLGHDKRIGDANRLAVEALRDLGCRVILASGRRHANILPFAEQPSLSDFIVSCQGAVAKHARTNELLHQALLPAPCAAEATAEGLDRGLTVMFWTPDGVFAPRQTKWIDRYQADCNGDGVALVDVQHLADRGTPAEKVVWGAEPETIASLLDATRTRYGHHALLTITDPFFLEFTSHQATKAAGVSAVAARYGVAQNEVLAFGDGNNDVSMLTWAGMGIAMPHGRTAARRAAKRVSPPGDPETAFARAVAELLGEADATRRPNELPRRTAAA